MPQTTYRTISGDMWDGVAYKVYGNANHTGLLMAANSQYLNYYIFPAGISLIIPEAPDAPPDSLPPWKRKKQ